MGAYHFDFLVAEVKMPKKYHLKPKPAPTRFVTPGPYGIIEGDGCLNCANCVKKFCIYSVYGKRGYDQRQMFDTADSLCKNCFRCVQGCYGRILSKSRNPEFWKMGDDYWTPEIIASNQCQSETGKIPVSGGGYGGPFSGPGFDSMWTDMSEIVRPTRDGIHGREYISTTIELGRILQMTTHPSTQDSARLSPVLSGLTFPPRVEASIPLVFDLLPFREFTAAVRLALAKAAVEANTLMIIRVEHLADEFLPMATHLVPFLPEGDLEGFIPAIRQARMVQVSFTENVMDTVREIKKINPGVVVCLRLPLTPRAEEEVESLTRAGAEVLHLLADEKGREQDAASPRFIKDLIRRIHLRLVKEGLRDGLSLIFGGGIALAEHVAKAIICGADAVSIERPLLFALECRLCEQCADGITCPVEVEEVDPEWGRQRVVNLIAAWHGQLLEVLGAMGMRDVRRLRGEVGRAIFWEEIEKETFGQIFRQAAQEAKPQEESIHVLSP
jgi:ferredoxin